MKRVSRERREVQNSEETNSKQVSSKEWQGGAGSLLNADSSFFKGKQANENIT